MKLYTWSHSQTNLCLALRTLLILHYSSIFFFHFQKKRKESRGGRGGKEVSQWFYLCSYTNYDHVVCAAYLYFYPIPRFLDHHFQERREGRWGWRGLGSVSSLDRNPVARACIVFPLFLHCISSFFVTVVLPRRSDRDLVSLISIDPPRFISLNIVFVRAATTEDGFFFVPC